MNDDVAGGFLFVIIVLMVASAVGAVADKWATRTMQIQAVERGYASWQTSLDGRTKFMWNDDLEEQGE